MRREHKGASVFKLAVNMPIMKHAPLTLIGCKHFHSNPMFDTDQDLTRNTLTLRKHAVHSSFIEADLNVRHCLFIFPIFFSLVLVLYIKVVDASGIIVFDLY